MNNVTIIGGGVLGTQIAFQCAFTSHKTTIWLRSKESIERTKPKLDNVKNEYIEAINKMSSSTDPKDWSLGIADPNNFNREECLQKVNDAYNSIKIELDLEKAVDNADIVIESMTENFDAKKDILIKLSKVLNDKTILVTNSSTMLPSKLAKYTGRPDKFLALHFANSIWKNNTAEVMMHKKTDEKYFNEVIEFARSLRMIPLPLKKEKSGYLLNSLLIPFLFSALDLYVNGISEPKYIDEAWTLGTGAPEGPFQILDVIGLKTAYEIVEMYTKVPSLLAPYNFKEMAKLLKKYIDEGKLGKSSKEGFYKYK